MTARLPDDEGSPLVLFLLCVAQFVLVLDVAIVNVALPVVQEEFGLDRGTLQLVVTVYGLAFGGLLLLGGRAADLLGRRRVFLVGLALFTAASLACGLAPTGPVLVGARAVQGVGGALVSPAALALLLASFPSGPQRNRALGVWSALAAAGGATGLLLGGLLTEFAGWRWLFLINVVLGVPVLALATRVLPAGRSSTGGHIDVAGAVTVTAGLMALVYGLARIAEDGAAPLPLGLLAAAAVLLAVFVAVEVRAREPLLSFALFRARSLAAANLAVLLMSAVVVGSGFFLTLHLQQVLGLGPLQTGSAFLPQTVLAALASALAARVLDRVGARVLLIGGMLALAAGSLLLAGVSADGSYAGEVLPGLLLVAVGIGLGFTVGTAAATAGVPVEQQGAASAVLGTGQQVGGAVGLAALTALAAPSAAGTDATAGSSTAFLAMAALAVLAAGAAAAVPRSRATTGRADPAAAPVVPLPSAHSAPCQPGATRVGLTAR